MPRRDRIGLIFLLICTSLAGAAHGQVALQVSPVNVTLRPGQMAATFSVTDASESPTTLQVRPFLWQQTDSGEQLTPTDAVAVSPPIVAVDANATQTFRLVLQQPAQGVEGQYRLLIDQLPQPGGTGVVRVVLRLSVPVFVAAADGAPAAIDWRLERDDATEALVAHNGGGQHTRILDPVLRAEAGHPIRLAPQPTPYLLPGADMRWAIAAPLASGTALTLNARTDDGSVSQRLVAP